MGFRSSGRGWHVRRIVLLDVAGDAVGLYSGPEGESVVSSCDMCEFADGRIAGDLTAPTTDSVLGALRDLAGELC